MRVDFAGRRRKDMSEVTMLASAHFHPAHRLTMSTQNNKRKLDDAYGPTFDPGLDIATVVFSHVQCVKTRVNLALVSRVVERTPPRLPLRTLSGSTSTRSRTWI